MADILLIEDNEELRNLIKAFLERGGYAVAAVSSGEEALGWLGRERAKLMLLDIMLPGMDGFALCDKVRKENNIPIIILSACTEKEDQMNGGHGYTACQDRRAYTAQLRVEAAEYRHSLRRAYNRQGCQAGDA